VTITYSTGTQGGSNAYVVVTLETASAWSEVSEQVIAAVNEADETTVDVYIKDNTSLPGDALKAFAGKKVVVTIHNAGGSVWRIDCSQIGDNSKEIVFDLSYERLEATAEQLELLGCSVGYQIKFLSDAQVNAEVMIKLPLENARKSAALYQINRSGEKEPLQAVVVDDEGYAHYYLASVAKNMVYLIGIDVQEAVPAEVIVPETTPQEYGIPQPLSTMEYVVTGRNSSWGVNINQVTLFLVIGMVTVIAVVGGVMFALNKRKLKMGYIPDLDDDEEE
jgi:hypothetical protein